MNGFGQQRHASADRGGNSTDGQKCEPDDRPYVPSKNGSGDGEPEHTQQQTEEESHPHLAAGHAPDV